MNYCDELLKNCVCLTSLTQLLIDLVLQQMKTLWMTKEKIIIGYFFLNKKNNFKVTI